MYMLGYVFFMTLFRVQFMNLSMSYLKERMVLQHCIDTSSKEPSSEHLQHKSFIYLYKLFTLLQCSTLMYILHTKKAPGEWCDQSLNVIVYISTQIHILPTLKEIQFQLKYFLTLQLAEYINLDTFKYTLICIARGMNSFTDSWDRRF